MKEIIIDRRGIIIKGEHHLREIKRTGKMEFVDFIFETGADGSLSEKQMEYANVLALRKLAAIITFDKDG